MYIKMVKDDKHTDTVGTNALEKLGDFYFVYVIFIFFTFRYPTRITYSLK